MPTGRLKLGRHAVSRIFYCNNKDIIVSNAFFYSDLKKIERQKNPKQGTFSLSDPPAMDAAKL
jgi:hypothetical protein